MTGSPSVAVIAGKTDLSAFDRSRGTRKAIAVPPAPG
jgi:hypothetical protein